MGGTTGTTAPLLVRLVDAAARTIGERAAELDALDAAIGDGDHGTNLARGLARAAARWDELGAMPLGRALEDVGRTIARETGGDGGRIYGALLAGMGATAPDDARDLKALSRMLDEGVAAAREAGGAAPGDKTLIDVLQPVADALRGLAAEGRVDAAGARALAAAGHGLHRTSRLAAKRGRAADLGEATVNHLDPGAWSAALLVGAAVGVLEESGSGVAT